MAKKKYERDWNIILKRVKKWYILNVCLVLDVFKIFFHENSKEVCLSDHHFCSRISNMVRGGLCRQYGWWGEVV